MRLVRLSSNSAARSTLQRDLAFLKLRYPNGGEWLERTTRSSSLDIDCYFVVSGSGERAGAVITKRKSVRERKISTFFIAPAFRRHGFGGLVAKLLLERFFQENVDSVYITHCKEDIGRFGAFLGSVADWDEREAPDKYFRGKTEVISIARPCSMRSSFGATDGIDRII